VEPTEYTFSQTGIIDARPEDVIAWWFDPSRRVARLDKLERSAVGDVTVNESTEEGFKIRDLHYMDRRGWTHHHHVVTVLTPEGITERDGDRLFVLFSDDHNLLSAWGKKRRIVCNARFECIPQASGRTEVTLTHKHVGESGGRLERWKRRRCEHAYDRAFREQFDLCQDAIRQSVS
jgi:hypothetical protein